MKLTMIEVFAEELPDSFRAHAKELETNPERRAAYHAFADADLERWRRTPKWRLTSKLLRMYQPRCEKCGAIRNLQVHHKTYEHVGFEIICLGDLEVLCDLCHRARTLTLGQGQLPLRAHNSANYASN